MKMMITVITPEGEEIMAELNGQMTVGEIIAEHIPGGHRLKREPFVYAVDGQPAQLNTLVTHANSKVSVVTPMSLATR